MEKGGVGVLGGGQGVVEKNGDVVMGGLYRGRQGEEVSDVLTVSVSPQM